MLDIIMFRRNPDMIRDNIRRKFQDEKLPLVDKVIDLDLELREIKGEADSLRNQRNIKSKEIGVLYAKGESKNAENLKVEVENISIRLEELKKKENELPKEINKLLIMIPNIMDKSVPLGKDDSGNVEKIRYGEAIVPNFDIPYHVDIMENLNGIDLESSRNVSGSGFYYFKGNIARLHSAILSYARDFMIDRGFTYYIPPHMIRGHVVTGVVNFDEIDTMMYKIEGEDLFLIGTSEHSMIGKFMNTISNKETLPQTLTSYSPCFRKEVGAHGIEERGVFRVHQFEKQEMIVICEPTDSHEWFEQLYNHTVDFFRSLEIPVRVLEICSGDLADLKVKQVDVEAWSPRQQKYFEVGSCSNLTDAQSRRLNIRIKGENVNYFPHILNNTVIAAPRALIAFLENNLNHDGSVRIPEPLRCYMGGKEVIS